MHQTSHIMIEASPNLSKSKALRYERYDSLKSETVEGQKYFVETDIRFVQSVTQLSKLKASVLDDLMGLKNSLLTDADCDQIHFKARRHCQANILNRYSGMSKKDIEKNPALKSLYCKCGCEQLRGEHYPMNQQLQKISILGSGILLFFYFLKALAIALIFFIAVFAIFALATNLLGNTPINTTSLKSACTSSYCNFRDNASDNFKKNQESLGYIQLWLGLAAMALWVIISRIVRYVGDLKNKEIDKSLKSASDFAIKISNLPYGEFNQEELMEYFQKLSEKQELENQTRIELRLSGNVQREATGIHIRPKSGSNESDLNNGLDIMGKIVRNAVVENTIIGERSLGIKAIQIIYNMEFSRKMIQKIVNLAVQVKGLTKQRDHKWIIQDKLQYISCKNDLIQTYEVFEDLRKKFLNDPKFRKALSTRVAIVQFHNETDKDTFLDAYGKTALTFFSQIKQKLLDKCFGDHNTIVFKGSIPAIVRAPEPSDVIWQNCEKKESIWRILFIYFITFILIMISLGIMVGLQYGQSIIAPSLVTNSTANATSNSTGIRSISSESESISTLVNIVVSVVMQIINAALWVSLSFLLQLEYNHTFTNKIISQMTKTSVAMWINIIILPIIVNYFINNRYYGADGLAGIVFDYHISTITVGLTVKLLDPMSLLIWLGIEIRCIRNYLIKARYQKANSDAPVTQEAMRNVYKLYEAPQFSIAQAYTYILSNILHAAFFCELQPFLLLLALVQTIGFFWVCKFKVLKWCQIPKMTEKLIFDVALSMFMLVPVFYGVGSIFNSYISSRIEPTRHFSVIPQAICVGIGLLCYFNPYNSVQKFIKYFIIQCRCCFQKHQQGSNISENIDPEKQQKERVETYYKTSNSLSLLGFENLLLGKRNMTGIANELQNYCESHIRGDADIDETNKNEKEQEDVCCDTEFKDVIPETNSQF